MRGKSIILLFLAFIFRANTVFSQDSTCLAKDSLPVLSFKENSTKLTPGNKRTLDSIIKIAAQCPTHCIVVYGSSYGENNKYNILMWDRAETVVKYLSEKQKKNCVFSSSSGMINFDGLIYFKLELPLEGVSPPHPNLMKKKTTQ